MEPKTTFDDALDMSLARKLLLAMFMVALTGSAFGAGTFASFSASTTNAGSTFATGTLVLSDKKGGSANTCYSTGTTNNGVGTGNTDTNANTTCEALFSVTAAKPGDPASTQTVDIKNEGSVDAASLKVYGYPQPAGCAPTDGAGSFHGSGDPCDVIQAYIQAPGSVCKYGKNASGVVNGTSAITFPLNITGSNGTFNLTVDGTAHDTLVIPTNAAYTATTLTTAINALISAWATANVGSDNILYISSNAATGVGATSNVTFNATTPSNNAATALGMTNNTTHSASATACAFDAVHTLKHFNTTYTNSTNGISLPGLTAGGAATTYTVGVQFPTAAGNSYQGRIATFGFTWTAAQ